MNKIIMAMINKRATTTPTIGPAKLLLLLLSSTDTVGSSVGSVSDIPAPVNIETTIGIFLATIKLLSHMQILASYKFAFNIANYNFACRKIIIWSSFLVLYSISLFFITFLFLLIMSWQ